MGLFGGRSSHLEEHEIQVAEIDQHYRQIGRRAFHGDLQGIRLPLVTIFRESTFPEVWQSGWLGSSGVVLLIPRAATGDGCLSGHFLRPGQFAVLSGDREFLFRTPTQLDLQVLMVKDELVRSALGDDYRLPGRSDICVHDFKTQQSERVTGVLARLVGDDSGRIEGRRNYCSASANLTEVVQELLVTILGDHTVNPRAVCPRPPSLAARTRIVRGAMELIHSGLNDGVTVLGLCSELDVSRRHLQKCFEQTLGINPAEYILRQRLVRARTTLCKRRFTGAAMVTEAATSCGFTHLGRFSAYYRRMFGESPRQTIASR